MGSSSTSFSFTPGDDEQGIPSPPSSYGKDVLSNIAEVDWQGGIHHDRAAAASGEQRAEPMVDGDDGGGKDPGMMVVERKLRPGAAATAEKMNDDEEDDEEEAEEIRGGGEGKGGWKGGKLEGLSADEVGQAQGRERGRGGMFCGVL